ncbi:Mth938-like domain-containing protein [Aquella oligotrophica]|uniref:Uncharacterized protein n=1 Tax=Aquella oligotrophica TaxID=2067065 RepID=A0A2I7N4X0_9NEIS|nr:MTH938/NDUFAF3 family protein [Aquella oligotrophica]AUR51513.1 hypothetical protein CUN60_04150 [Aquella oligotrophica]
MQVNLHSNEGNQFTNYSTNSVTINQVEYSTNLLVTPNAIKPVSISFISELTDTLLDEILSHKPDIIIFGTGSSIKYPERNILIKLQQLRIGFEVMPVAALCRTFNYLIGEGRNVVGVVLF